MSPADERFRLDEVLGAHFGTHPDVARSFRELGRELVRRSTARTLVVATVRRVDQQPPCAIGLAGALTIEADGAALLVDCANEARPESTRSGPPSVAGNGDGIAADESMWSSVTAVDAPLTLVSRCAQSRATGGRGQLAGLVRSARSEGYTSVVIQVASILDDDDWGPAADVADGVVLVVPRLMTRARDLRRAVEVLAPTPVLATLLV